MRDTAHRNGAFTCNIAARSEGSGDPKGENNDRVLTVRTDRGMVLAVADGAGRSARAAEFVISQIQAYAELQTGEQLPQLFRRLDDALAADRRGGETTAVVVIISVDGPLSSPDTTVTLTGCSVGDSKALLADPSGITDLTLMQKRKPLLGSGDALPMEFSTVVRGEFSLFLACDGVHNYLSYPRLLDLTRGNEPSRGVESAFEALRLPSGTFRDDTSLVFVKRARLPRDAHLEFQSG